MTSIESVTLDVADPAAGGTGSHRLMIGGDAGTFTGPDGFAWKAASL